jgi:hypothetical protein
MRIESKLQNIPFWRSKEVRGQAVRGEARGVRRRAVRRKEAALGLFCQVSIPPYWLH